MGYDAGTLKKCQKALTFVLFLSGVCLTIFGVIVLNEIGINNLEPRNCVVFGIDCFGMTILTCLLYSYLIDELLLMKSDIIAEIIIFGNILGHFSNLMSWLLDGRRNCYYYGNLFVFIYYALIIILPLCYCYYLIYERKESGINYNLKYMIVPNILAFFSVVVLILNIKMRFFYDVNINNKYIRGEYYYLSAIIPIFLVLYNVGFSIKSNNTLKNKIILLTYSVIPIAFFVVEELFFGINIVFFGGTIAIIILHCSLYMSRGSQLELKKSELMLSQLKPHFISNSMMAIRRLIKKDQDKAIEAMDSFIDYFRESIDLLQNERLVSIKEEMKFVTDYLNMEKLRFGEDLEFSIEDNNVDFMLPSFTIQPIVENAVRHGIRKKVDGKGKVNICVTNDEKNNIIIIEDNGVGFNVDDYENNYELRDGHYHIGVGNIIFRVEKMCYGTVKIKSEIGKGTKVTITIP